MLVNKYYSVRVLDDGGYEDVGEDGLLSLCRDCAKKHRADVQWVSRGDDQSECEFCRASNDPANSAELDRLFAEYTHSLRAEVASVTYPAFARFVAGLESGHDPLDLGARLTDDMAALAEALIDMEVTRREMRERY